MMLRVHGFKVAISVLSCVLFTSLFFAGIGSMNYVSAENAVNHNIKNGTLTIVNESTNLNVPVSEGSTETYLPADRLWNGIPTIAVKDGKIFAAWCTGGDKEPHDDNYIVVAISEDGGKNWVDPWMIIDPVNSNKAVVVPMFRVDQNGDLWLNYSWLSNGCWSVKIVNTDRPISEITYADNHYVSPSGG